MTHVSLAPAKFLFDTSFDAPDFDAPGSERMGALALADLRPLEERAMDAAADAPFEVASAIVPEPAPPPEPLISAAELDAAKRIGFAEGHDAGVGEARASIEERMVRATERLVEGLSELAGRHGEAMQRVEHQAVEFALSAIRKLFPELRRRGAVAEIEALIENCLNQALDEPRVIVRCAESQLEGLTPTIQAIAKRTGFDGKLIIVSDPRCGEADCRLEWADGGAERDSQRLMHEIEAVVSRRLKPLEKLQGSLFDDVDVDLDPMTTENLRSDEHGLDADPTGLAGPAHHPASPGADTAQRETV
ncbi:MAG TPA: hypothetical protein VNT30_00990 [Stellaceae bacterium]|nr:hypothetical protein [Stellaceae bacterium]